MNRSTSSNPEEPDRPEAHSEEPPADLPVQSEVDGVQNEDAEIDDSLDESLDKSIDESFDESVDEGFWEHLDLDFSTRDFFLIFVIIVVAVMAVIFLGPFFDLNPDTERKVSAFSMLIMMIMVLGWVAYRGYLGELLRVPVKENILLSQEVMGALVGSIFTVVLGAFVVNHLMESAEERSAVRSAVQAHYSEKVELLKEFSDQGQKILYYAYEYRKAEEWLRWHEYETSINAGPSQNPGDRAGEKYGLGERDKTRTFQDYTDLQKDFVEAGSLHGLARAVESNFFNSYELNDSLARSFRIGTHQETDSDALATLGNLKTKPLIEKFDRFLQPIGLSEAENYGQAERILREYFKEINKEYSLLIEEMYLRLAADRQGLATMDFNEVNPLILNSE